MTTLSAKPVVIPAPDRGADLHVRVTAPATGTGLPLILLSHGFGESLDSYDPLVDHWTAHGFAVVQPTHLDSRTLALPPEDPRTPLIWRHRVADLTRVLDALDEVEAAVPGLTGRIDRARIAVAGHSYGAQTAGVLLGARVLDASGVPGEDLSDHRVRAGVLLAATGLGGADLSPFAAEHFPFMSPSFAELTTPALVVAGDADQSALTATRGPDWFTDAFHHAPGATHLLTLVGGEHTLGGIQGRGAAATTDENPERVAAIARLTTAYLLGALGGDDAAWTVESSALDAAIGWVKGR
ncbi:MULTISPECIES: alpha/beta fold hydrolase [Actinosynnema]|uniref:alpha/beta hydrolase family protein n=1 Tax=Actinosynnema TaxID=40566 RepID=UPI0020A3B185|nr:alpha/beta fold hydrolase [Actinosynnema pretiosum]MCP2096697.1 Alpha/beta hydrolase family protein [Actinosynnema pretiosum]